MSDVWQGPGWWLASDGKWYPAEAEPGAVYDGELANDDSSASDTAMIPGVSAPVTVDEHVDPDVSSIDSTASIESTEAALSVDDTPLGTPETVPEVESEPTEIPDAAIPDAEIPDAAIPDMAIPDAEIPDAAIPDMAIPDAAIPDMAIPDAAGDSMPDPIVQTSGGWQAIDPTEAEPERALEDEAFAALADHDGDGEPTEEDGWTSAFEERQASSEVLDDLSVTAPASAGIALDDVAAPEPTIPDIPDLAAPEATIPDIPDLAAPEPTIPGIPDLAAPEATIPDVPDIPDLAAPEPTIPDIPDLAAPEATIPEVPDLASSIAPDVDVVDAPAVQIDEVMPLGTTALGDRQTTAPIERQDAWRKPIPGADTDIEDLRPGAAANRGAPDVVDLAIPEDSPPPQEVEAPKRNWGMWIGILLVFALIGLIAWFIAMLFAGNETNDTATDTTSTSEAVAAVESSEAPSDEESGDTASTEAPDTSEESSPPETLSEDSSVFELRAGDCIVGDIGAGQVTRVEVVDCEIEHQFEVYREALIESSITTFDETAISTYAEEVCRTSLAAYIPANDDRNLKFKFLQPTEDSWNQPEDPDRVITCLLFDGDGDPLVGRAN